MFVFMSCMKFTIRYQINHYNFIFIFVKTHYIIYKNIYNIIFYPFYSIFIIIPLFIISLMVLLQPHLSKICASFFLRKIMVYLNWLLLLKRFFLKFIYFLKINFPIFLIFLFIFSIFIHYLNFNLKFAFSF